MEDKKYESLKLSNQLCFPLYACSREVIKRYKPYLDRLDLTYTQYIAMMVLWERRQVNVKELGECLYLDSGTLTPLLKKMEHKGLVSRTRSDKDERNLIVSVTDRGLELRDKALSVPAEMASYTPLTPEDSATLYALLYKILVSDQDKD